MRQGNPVKSDLPFHLLTCEIIFRIHLYCYPTRYNVQCRWHMHTGTVNLYVDSHLAMFRSATE